MKKLTKNKRKVITKTSTLKRSLMKIFTCYWNQHSAMLREEKTFLQSSTGIQTTLWDVCILVIFSQIQMETFCKNATKSILSLNLIREVLNQALAETCMPFSQLGNQPMGQEVTLLSETLESLLQKMNMEKLTRMENYPPMSRNSTVELSQEPLCTFWYATRIVRMKTTSQKDVWNG